MYSCDLTVSGEVGDRSATMTSRREVLRNRESKQHTRCWGRAKRPVTLVTRLGAKPTGEAASH